MKRFFKFFGLSLCFSVVSLVSCDDANASIPEDDTPKDEVTEVMVQWISCISLYDEPSLNKRYEGEEKFMKDLKCNV